MKSATRSPRNCEHSIERDGIYICKMSLSPCALHFDRECELDRLDSLTEALSKLLWGDKTDEEVTQHE